MTVGQKTKIKIKKFGPHSVASKITEELRKQKSNRKGWILFCKRFQTCSFMSQKKSFRPNKHVSNSPILLGNKKEAGIFKKNFLSLFTKTEYFFYAHETTRLKPFAK